MTWSRARGTFFVPGQRAVSVCHGVGSESPMSAEMFEKTFVEKITENANFSLKFQKVSIFKFFKPLQKIFEET